MRRWPLIYCVVPAALADELYDKLVAYYADDPNVTVIVDRRRGERRTRGEAGGGKRQLRDRRQRSGRLAAPRASAMKLVVHVDGGARGNPGPAAIGVVVSDAEGGVLEELGEPIGETTNNVAEYRALLRGLERARALGADEVEVVGDSELVAKQVNGQYKVKHAGLRPLHARGAAGARVASSAGRCAPSRAPRTRAPTRSSTRRSTQPPEPRPAAAAPRRFAR